MSRSRTRLISRSSILASICLVAVLASSGCYRRVVDARGLGADSGKLRREHESQPLDFITTETRREKRDVRPARDREQH